MQCAESPRFHRLHRAWPNLQDDPSQRWSAQQHPVQGTMVVWPGQHGSGLQLDAFGPPRVTHDGLTYYPSLEKPTPIELMRDENTRLSGTWVSLYGGGELFIALATATPREIILCASGGIKIGRHKAEYGLLAHDLYEPFLKEGITFEDPRLGRLLFLALQQSYCITEEMIEDLGWICEADISPIIHAIMGIDPKASAVALAGSASQGQSTPTSP
jgi:hypothetical protein